MIKNARSCSVVSFVQRGLFKGLDQNVGATLWHYQRGVLQRRHG